MQKQAHRLTNSRSYYEKENKQGGTNPPNQENKKPASQIAPSQTAPRQMRMILIRIRVRVAPAEVPK